MGLYVGPLKMAMYLRKLEGKKLQNSSQQPFKRRMSLTGVNLKKLQRFEIGCIIDSLCQVVQKEKSSLKGNYRGKSPAVVFLLWF